LRQQAEDALEAEAKSIGDFLRSRFPNIATVRLRSVILDLLSMPSSAVEAVNAIRLLESELSQSRPLPVMLLNINFDVIALQAAVFRAFPD